MERAKPGMTRWRWGMGLMTDDEARMTSECEWFGTALTPALSHKRRRNWRELRLWSLVGEGGVGSFGVELVEDAGFAEVVFLGAFPAAEDFVDGDELEGREFRREFLESVDVAGAVVEGGDHLLGLGGVEELEVGLGGGSRALGIHDLVDDRDWGLGQDRHARVDDLELLLAEFLDGEP